MCEGGGKGRQREEKAEGNVEDTRGEGGGLH